MQEWEVAKLFKDIKRAYPSFDASRENLDFWQRYLRKTTADVADHNLERHILSGNKFPPGVAEIVRPIDPEQDNSARYHQAMRESAQEHFANLEHWKVTAVGPTPEQRERVRAAYERSTRRH